LLLSRRIEGHQLKWEVVSDMADECDYRVAAQRGRGSEEENRGGNLDCLVAQL
jgi:hypothetical protein